MAEDLKLAFFVQKLNFACWLY